MFRRGLQVCAESLGIFCKNYVQFNVIYLFNKNCSINKKINRCITMHLTLKNIKNGPVFLYIFFKVALCATEDKCYVKI